MTPFTHHYLDVDGTTIHCVETGTGSPVLLLHQTPRSWDEYRDVLPLLGTNRRAIAMDTAGFGDSERLPAGTDSIERWAAVVVGLLDALGLAQATIVGHHTGGYVAAEVAAAYPDRVHALVLSGVALHEPEDRLAHATGRAVVDDVDPALDGSHLLELWRIRAPFYPPDVSLLERFMRDCLRAGDLAAEGHRVVARYPLDERVGLIGCPTLLLAPLEDAYAFPAVPGLDTAIPHATVTPIPGGMVPLPDQLPDAFATAVRAFLDELDA